MGLLGDGLTSVRTTINEKYSNQYRSFSLKWKSTKLNKNIDAMLAYREIHEALINL